MNGWTVLLVDDERPMRRYLAANLTARGYAVVEAADGSEALGLLAAGGIDLLILDLVLPGVDGLEVLWAAREQAGVPVILMSADPKALERVRGLARGANSFLVKPFGLEELLAAMRASERVEA